MYPCSGRAHWLAGRFGDVSMLNLRDPLKADVPCHDIWPAPRACAPILTEIVARRCGYVKNMKTCCAFGGHCGQGMFNTVAWYYLRLCSSVLC